MSPIEKLYHAKKVLAFLTHPDDEILLGPLLKWIPELHIVYTVDGVPGDCFNGQCAGGKPLAVVRQEELAKSATHFGFTYTMAHLPFVGAASSLGEQLSNWQTAAQGYLDSSINELLWAHRPDCVVTFNPAHGTTTFDDHTISEHIATAVAVRNALDGHKNLIYIDHRLDIREGSVGFKGYNGSAQRMQVTPQDWEGTFIAPMRDIYKSQFDGAWIAKCAASTPDMRVLRWLQG